MKPVRVAIEASNLQVGGGVTYLRETLAHLDPREHGIERIGLWASRQTLDQIEERPWIEPATAPVLQRGSIQRFYWQWRHFSPAARTFGAQVAFVPGGTFLGHFRPFVAVAHNLLPFDTAEIARHGFHPVRLRLQLLARLQARTFHNSQGVIFLSDIGRDYVQKKLRSLPPRQVIIPYGIADRFLNAPRPARPCASFTEQNPARLLYVSHISHYKHPWNVAEAVRQVRAAGIPAVLDLIGPVIFPPAMRRLTRVLARIDPEHAFVRYRGEIPYLEMARVYGDCDLFVFASTCESFGAIVLEAMAAGLPIACSNRGASPEVLGAAGEYFDALDAGSIARALIGLLQDQERRHALACAAHTRARLFDWRRSARETFAFIVGSTQPT